MSQSIYVIREDGGEDEDQVIGIFLDQDKAQEYVDRRNNRYGGENYYISEWRDEEVFEDTDGDGWKSMIHSRNYFGFFGPTGPSIGVHPGHNFKKDREVMKIVSGELLIPYEVADNDIQKAREIAESMWREEGYASASDYIDKPSGLWLARDMSGAVVNDTGKIVGYVEPDQMPDTEKPEVN